MLPCCSLPPCHTEPVEVSPASPGDINIANHVIGDKITVGCAVDTCYESVTVSLYKGSQRVGQLTSEWSSKRLYNFEVTVDEWTAGRYACAADVWSKLLGSASAMSHDFNVVGKSNTSNFVKCHIIVLQLYFSGYKSMQLQNGSSRKWDNYHKLML